MSDKRGMMSAGHGSAGLAETMMTADSLQLTVYGRRHAPGGQSADCSVVAEPAGTGE